MAEPTVREHDPDDLPSDIRERVVADFGPDLADAIYRELLDRVPDGLPNGTRPRHLRCILHLARGDRALLERYIEVCLEDTRDVMLWAEYDKTSTARPVRVRDFRKPFDQSQIRKSV